MNACKVMAIVNVTPDSFSDGGRYFSPEEAIRRAANCAGEGADILDLGGESTRPGAEPLDWSEEWRRLEPVLSSSALAALGLSVSVDTYHPETARRALDLGAKIVNCVRESSVPDMLDVLRAYPQSELVLPASFPRDDMSPDLQSRLYLDPMIGFGTTREEDLALLKDVSSLSREGRVLVGASRKRIVKKLTGERVTGKNLGGNLAIALWCVAQGASVVRVHDVRETVQAIRVWNSLR